VNVPFQYFTYWPQ